MLEVTHGYAGVAKLLSEQLVFAKLDCAVILKEINLLAITSSVTSFLGQSEASLGSEL